MLTLKKFTLSTFIITCKNSILAFMHLQFFITLCSLPLLSIWGLPFSIVSPVGNFLFAPYMTGYLFLALIIFISELFFIPNQILLYGLERYTDFWIWLLSYNSPTLIIPLPCYGLLLYSTVAFVAVVMLFLKIKSIIRIQIYCALLSICLMYTVLSLNTVKETIVITHDNQSIIIKEYAHKKILCCFNTLAQQRSDNFMRYTVYNTCNTLGITCIPFVLCSNSSTGSYCALATLITNISVKHLFLTKPHTMHSKIIYQWNMLLEKAASLKVQIHIVPQEVLLELEQLFIRN